MFATMHCLISGEVQLKYGLKMNVCPLAKSPSPKVIETPVTAGQRLSRYLKVGDTLRPNVVAASAIPYAPSCLSLLAYFRGAIFFL